MSAGLRTAKGIVKNELNCMGRQTEERESRVSEGKDSRQDPEYRGTRETPWEAGGTTLQA
jgi:hypothetical protein